MLHDSNLLALVRPAGKGVIAIDESNYKNPTTRRAFCTEASPTTGLCVGYWDAYTKIRRYDRDYLVANEDFYIDISASIPQGQDSGELLRAESQVGGQFITQLVLRFVDDGKLRVFGYGNSPSTPDAVLTPGGTNHIRIARRSTEVVLFVDGVLVATLPDSSADYPSTPPLRWVRDLLVPSDIENDNAVIHSAAIWRGTFSGSSFTPQPIPNHPLFPNIQSMSLVSNTEQSAVIEVMLAGVADIENQVYFEADAPVTATTTNGVTATATPSTLFGRPGARLSVPPGVQSFFLTVNSPRPSSIKYGSDSDLSIWFPSAGSTSPTDPETGEPLPPPPVPSYSGESIASTPNDLFDWARELFLTGQVNWLTDDIKCILVDTGYQVPNIASHRFMDSVIPSSIVAGPVTLIGRRVVAGAADADDATFTSVSGATIEAAIIYKDTGFPATSPLIACIKPESNQAIRPNGGDIVAVWSNGADKIFKV